MNWEVNLQPVWWSVAGLIWWAAGVVLTPCGGGANGQEQCGIDGRLLAFGCLGSRSTKMRRVVQWSCRRVSLSCAAGCPEMRRDPARLQASESVLCSLLSGEAWRSSEAAGK
jgi:hypothetical protein